jgi:hypothetical protein
MFERQIDQYTLNGEFVKTHKNSKKAAESLGKTVSTNIGYCARGLRKTCYGFLWKFVEQPDLENEIWKSHPTLGFKVSSFGRVEGRTGRRTYGSKAGNGYMNYCYSKQKYKGVHVLVAETFLKPWSEVVHHVDRNRSNNKLDNLLWTTQKENIQAYHSLIPKFY